MFYIYFSGLVLINKEEKRGRRNSVFTHFATRRSKNNNYENYYFHNYYIGLGFQELVRSYKSWRRRNLSKEGEENPKKLTLASPYSLYNIIIQSPHTHHHKLTPPPLSFLSLSSSPRIHASHHLLPLSPSLSS